MNQITTSSHPLSVYRERGHDELHQLSIALYESGFFQDLKSAAQAYAKMFYGQSLGISPIDSLNLIHAVPSGGKVTLQPHYKLILAKVRRHPNYDFKILSNTEAECSIEFYRRNPETGKMESEGVSTYTRPEAVRAGLVDNSAWKNQPKDMFLASAARKGVTRFAPDVMVFPDDTPIVTIEEVPQTEEQARQVMENFFILCQDNMNYSRAEVINILRVAGYSELDARNVQEYYNLILSHYTESVVVESETLN